MENSTKTNALLIVGPGGSGKTALAMMLANPYRPDGVVMYNARRFKPKLRFAFTDCNENTKLIIMDDVLDERWLVGLFNYVADGLKYQQRGRPWTTIYPAIICTSEKVNPSSLDIGTLRRFEIINLDDTSLSLGDMLRFGNEVLARPHYALRDVSI